jgi:hypothetical protein
VIIAVAITLIIVVGVDNDARRCAIYGDPWRVTDCERCA